MNSRTYFSHVERGEEKAIQHAIDVMGKGLP